ncbi:MAG: SDR family NAD(P)-dependent oxidoreductase, partial [Candidatus Binataceae bacterium]
MRLADKVALITGAGSGMGREAAVLFASEGARVAVADIDEKGAKETVAAITKAGGKAFAFKADVSKSAEVEAMVAATVEQFGGL